MPLVPWWALLSSGCAPVVLIIGWALAGSLQPAGYDPMVQSISALAARGAADPWLMTGALYLLGVCHLATAIGLRPAALAGRAALACGGLASLVVALSPEPGDGGISLRHLTSTGVGFTVLALWPVLAAVRESAVRDGVATWALRPATGYTVTALMTAGAAWFLLELHGHGDAGFVERVLAGAQSIWPLIVVATCLAGRLRAPATPLPAEARSRPPSRTG
jgi:hypothetical membrane protein